MKSSRSCVCVIPARYGSKRLPGKPLATIRGIPLVIWVYNRVAESGVFDDVVVATDDTRIRDTVRRHGGKAIMTSKKHATGTDRVLEAVGKLRCRHVVNVQGDEPQIPIGVLKDFSRHLRRIDDHTLLTCATNATIDEMDDPDVVKVVLAGNGDALYFSRSAIPYRRSGGTKPGYKHIGIYGFTRSGLRRFCRLPRSVLEQTEKLEQLRALEGGMRVRCLVRRYRSIGIDTKEDLAAFRRLVGGRKGARRGKTP
ncbi:MAG: 3-deoxy-manno-octulosonate cytidylyltransferase [Chitinivibrionales bacterium]|nr:3-deoxy-manno-octulosonate cytidylyltransferase [Chitinivibrionales bacterium]MBD3394774.1 3-deoxy-manno-octulosonate cytidylyltransferase [Chitinivibrionales bacterium]